MLLKLTYILTNPVEQHNSLLQEVDSNNPFDNHVRM